MAQKTVAYLKGLWIRGYKPLEQDFVDLFDSFWHKSDIPTVASSTVINESEYFGLSNDVISTIGNTGMIIIDTIDANNKLIGIPKVFINGVKYNVGQEPVPANNQCFFSNDGTTVKTLSQIVQLDKLYWNPSFINSFDLSGDKITINYTIQS